MEMRKVQLSNRVDESREWCSWRKCRRPANHCAEFEMQTNRGWKPRMMGLCDQHRGKFKRQWRSMS